jgi:ATP-dependent Lon protease
MSELSLVNSNIKTIDSAMQNIMAVLDESIYGHSYAKNQIMKIIGQWMNGKQSGYCFGFEGSPGIGKTSLAKKGLSKCLCDESNIPRPFSFIALGGSSNGNVIEGHGYTYVNSTWGKIADILMEAKCMNPIIYVDELDKVSKTENGKEIIGIFTHLIDQTQNNGFQDKYFSGIDLDLSKALFIFSYNDPEQIDRILLDRIHRIKFDNLSLDDKMVIVRKFILPEINKKMGFINIVDISDEIIEYIIESYTVEPGVRKLKEILFDLYGEINLEILKTKSTEVFELPIIITKENLENKYLEKYTKIQEKRIHGSPQIGVINGLWANSLGRGGIIPIQTLLYPSSVFLDLNLTGLQGDVMKESMNVAKTLAWNLTTDDRKTELLAQFEKTKCQGLHIHCPEGAVSKDGPSAGAAITTAIYSLFNQLKIKNDIAITGEINLQGEVTAIGGLDVKIQGGIRSGVTTFLYPKSNHKEFMDWKNKNKKTKTEEITFIEVSTIDDVFKCVFA